MDLFADSRNTVRSIWTPSSPVSRRVRLIVAVSLMVFAFTLTEVGAPFSTASAEPAFKARPTWVSPVPAMEIVEAFDPPTESWLRGHRGIDVLTVSGEPVRAPAGGTIRFRGSVASTPTMSIETESGYVISFQPAESTLETGEAFPAGAEIGTVAQGGHCEESCLHVGIWKSEEVKKYIDPAVFFGQEQSILLPLSRKPAHEHTGDSTRSGAGAWGGHRNGRIPAAAMCPVKSAPGQMLRCDAQAAFDRMSHAYEARFSTPISVTDAYRDYDTQVILKRRKGRMAARPGTSNHGWALAVDLGGGINSFGSAEHQWMRANAPKFGWIHPGWARQSGSLPEPWHWEFRR
ncbi:MAG TPA: peptidase M15 [Brevibacterium sp.]|uniref:Peptidase family M23 n=2 Tax=Brevibacteriaceae TaxID=85019 RepID=A0A2H1JEX7_9MICO|nr:Peptidase family M23 [Brevibacterium antiquum CNRZ 918]HCG57236.1 peptidase M15 [Brevibacterium sp.]